MSDLVERLRDDAESVEEIGCSSSQGRKVVSMTLREAANEIERLREPPRCDKCGSVGDVFVLCAGCQSPLPSTNGTKATAS